MKVCIYARVSTPGQELEQQVAECRRYCDYKGHQVAAEYSDIGSGKSFTRPRFLAMVRELRDRRYDAVVVFRLDRLGRKARDLALLVDELEDRGIHVYSVRESFDTSTPIGRAMREMIYIMAELEREQISEATKQRLEALRAAGKKLGRPAVPRKTRQHVLQLRSAGMSCRQIAEKVRVSVGTVSTVCKAEKLTVNSSQELTVNSSQELTELTPHAQGASVNSCEAMGVDVG